MAASVSFQAHANSGGNTIGNGQSYTFPMTVAAASGQERIVFVSCVGNPQASMNFSSVTIDGQSATQVGATARGTSVGGDAAIITGWRAAGTANTSINVVATFSGAACFAGYAALYSLNDAGTLLDSDAVGGAFNPSGGVDTATGGAVAGGFYGWSSDTNTSTWTGLTEDFDGVTAFGDECFSGASASNVSAETPRSVSVSASVNDSVGLLLLSFNPAAAGGAALSVAPIMQNYRNMGLMQ